MEIIIMERQRGKSTLIAERLREDENALAIVATIGAKERFCASFKIPQERVLTIYNATQGGLTGREYSYIFIDEVGWCLSHLIKNFKMGTHTNDV